MDPAERIAKAAEIKSAMALSQNAQARRTSRVGKK